MSGSVILVIVIVTIFLGAMIGMLVYINTGKDDAAAKERSPRP